MSRQAEEESESVGEAKIEEQDVKVKREAFSMYKTARCNRFPSNASASWPD